MSKVSSSLKKVAAAEKVRADIKELEEKTASMSLKKAEKSSIKDNLHHIADDARQLEEAEGETEKHLKKAISLRSEALHKQLEEASPEHKKEEHSKIARVKDDVSSLEKALRSDKSLDAATKKTVKSSLGVMNKAVRSLEEDSSDDSAKKTIA